MRVHLKQLFVSGMSNAGELTVRAEGPGAARKPTKTSNFTATLKCWGAARNPECVCSGFDGYTDGSKGACDIRVGHRGRFDLRFALTLDDDKLLSVDEQETFQRWGHPSDASGVPKVGEDGFVGDDVCPEDHGWPDWGPWAGNHQLYQRWARMHSGLHHVPTPLPLRLQRNAPNTKTMCVA